MRSKRRAFTSIEALMTIGIIAVTAGVSVPLYRNVFLDSELERTKEQVLKVLQTAQINAQAGRGQWGVYLPEGLLYRGETYESRDLGTETKMVEIPVTVELNGLNDVSFLAVSGEPSTEGDIYGTSDNGRQWIITIRKRGIFSTADSEDVPTGDTGGEESSSSSSSLQATNPYAIPCSPGQSFVIRSATRLDSSFPAQAVGAGQAGLTFDTAQASITLAPTDKVYLMGYDPTVSPTPAQHFTDDVLTLSTSLGVNTRTINYAGGACAPTRQSAPVEITNLFLSGSETWSVTAPVNAAFKDSCGDFASHTAYYLTVGACGDLGTMPGAQSSSSSTTSSSSSSVSSASSSTSSASSSATTSSSSSASTSSTSTSSSSSGQSSSSSTSSSASSSSSSDGGYGDTCEDRFVLGADGAIRLTGKASVRVYALGSNLKYSGVAVPVKLLYSVDGGVSWLPLFGGSKLESGDNSVSQRDEDTLANLPTGTKILLKIQGSNGTTYSRTQTTNDGTSRVRLFRRGDKLPAVGSLLDLVLPSYLKDYVSGGKSKAGRYDLLMLSYLNDVAASNADYLHASIVIHIDQEPDACVPTSSSSASVSSGSSSSATVKSPRVKFIFERLENTGLGNVDRAVFIGPQATQRLENEWITLVEDSGTPRNDAGMVEDVKGIAIERQGTAKILRVLNHGTLSSGKELVNLRIVFDGATVTSVAGEAAPNKPEGLDDGVITDGAGGDEAVIASDKKSVVIYTRTTTSDDGFLIKWVTASSSSSSSVASSSSSSSTSSVSSSSSSSSEFRSTTGVSTRTCTQALSNGKCACSTVNPSSREATCLALGFTSSCAVQFGGTNSNQAGAICSGVCTNSALYSSCVQGTLASSSSSSSTTSSSSSSSSSSSVETKVTLCHVVGSGYQNLTVGKSAVGGHLGHGDRLGNCTADEDDDGVENQDDLCPETSLDQQVLYWDDRLGVVLKGKSYRQGKKLTISRYTLEDTQGCSCTQLLSVAARTNAYYVTSGNPELYLLLQSLPDYYVKAAKSFGCAKGFMDNVSQK